MSKTNNRTDVHRPSEIIPADYRELFCYAHATSLTPVPGFNISLLSAQRLGRSFYAASDAHKGEAAPFKDSNGVPYPMASIHKGGPCDSCGAHHVMGSVFLHEPSGECIAVGHICASKMDLAMDGDAIRDLTGKRKALRLSVITKLRQREALRHFVSEASSELLSALHAEHYIVKDIRRKLILHAAKYGAKLSMKQEALVLKLAREETAKANMPAEVNVAVPISDTRQTIEGTVVSCKIHDSAYGSTLKMTVKVTTDAGVWLVWGTCPSALGDGLELGNDGLRGCTVRFDAKLQAGREAHFAFFKRPAKATVVALGESQLAHLRKMEADLAMDIDEDLASTNWVDDRSALIARMKRIAAPVA